MSKFSGIRVFGGTVNSNEAYVDYNIVGTDTKGQIHLENVNDPTDTLIWDNERIKEVFEDDLAMNSGDIPVPGDKLWNMMDNITKRRGEKEYNNFADSEIEEAQKCLFLAAVEQGKDE